MNHLTSAYILNKEQLFPIILHKEAMLPQKGISSFLLIYSRTSLFTKITIYPVEHLPITKYFLYGSNIHQATINQILAIINSVSPKILHTSGIMYIENQYCYEFYFSGVAKQDLCQFKDEILKLDGIEELEDSLVPFYNHK